MILDTNVVSELMRAEPDRTVTRFLDGTSRTPFCISSITVWEVEYGARLDASDRRGSDLITRFQDLVGDLFVGGVLPYGAREAAVCATLMALSRRAGRSLDDRFPDAMIAATASARGMPLATRDTRDFEGLGLALLDPWAA